MDLKEAVADFVEQTLKPAKSAQGRFITTSPLAEGVHEVRSGQRLDLVDGAKLQDRCLLPGY
jgi:restriction endonuclease Mrr